MAGMDDFVQFEAAPEEDQVPELVLGKKKKKKKKPKAAEEADAPPANGATADDDGVVPALDLGKKKKKKKKKAAPSVDDGGDEGVSPDAAVAGSAFASLLGTDDDGGADEDTEDQNVEDALAALEIDDVAPVPKKKKKKKRPVAAEDDESLMESISGEGETSLTTADEKVAACEEEVVVKKPLTAAEKKKAKKEREKAAKKKKAEEAAAAAAAEEEDIDQILASLDGPAGPTNDVPKEAVEPIPAAAEGDDIDDLLGELDAPAKAGGKKTKKKKKAAAKKDDMDSLLNEFNDDAAADAPVDAPNGSAPADSTAVDSVDGLLADLGDEDGGTKMTAAQKKKAKKKKKAAAAKTGDDANASTDAAAGGKKKKESAAVRRMREQVEAQAKAAEAERAAREEEENHIAEEERLKQEAENKKAEERARKKAAEKARKERKRAEGTLLSKAEKERRRKGELYKAQLRAQGLIPDATDGDAGAGPAGGGAGPFSNRRRKKNAQAGNTTASTADAPPKEDDPVVEPEKEEVVEPVAGKSVPEEWDAVPDDWEKEEEPKVAQKSEMAAGSAANAGGDASGGSGEDSSDESGSDNSEDGGYQAVQLAIERKQIANQKARTADNLRSPIICILGHVDTGKTKILDRIRQTNVQDGEAGGITQQIGATYFPIDAVKKETVKLPEAKDLVYNVPSLLIIDTPGHESFTNLRTRGSSLCDIAILVIDIMHGIEPQTRESINLLKIRKTPFIVALNKIDRMFDWNAEPNNCPTRESLSKQPKHTQQEFHERVQKAQTDLMHEGFNSALYWENDEVTKTVSIVPTSAITGEGIPDLLMLLLSLPQKLLTPRLMYNATIEATVLEVKVISGLGTTIDIVLTGGEMKEGCTIMVVGLDGPIVTTVRALLTPHPMKEMRVKGQYLRHTEIKAAQGIKISAEGLDRAVAGTQIYVMEDPDNEHELEYAREEVMKDVNTILHQVDRSGVGVYVQASTLGSLEALLAFLESSKIPVSGINIGPVFKKDVKKASAMLERQKEYATILAFDVKVEGEARELAEELGVKIMTADIIYHLFDQFTAYLDDVKKERREAADDDVVFPSICKILPQHIYNKKDPIVVGVDVADGILRVGTPLVVRHGTGWLDVGRVASIEANQKQVKVARKGESVCIKIQHKNTEHIMYGRHFDFQDQLYSKMSRKAIDLLKEMFRNDLEKEDWLLVIKMKQMFNIN